MNTKFADKVFRFLLILAFVLGTVWVPNTSAGAQHNPNPTFKVIASSTNRYGRSDWVEGWDWTIGGGPVSVSVDDPGTPASPDASKVDIEVVACAFDPTFGCFTTDFSGMHDIQAGDFVSVIQGALTKTHEVLAVEITDVDPSTDVVSGTADPGSLVQVMTWDNMSGANRVAIADEFGDWFTDFTDTDSETNDFDIVGGNYVSASRSDVDGDSSMFGDRVPTPNIHGSAQYDWVRAREWPSGAEVHLTINGQDFGSAIVQEPQSEWDSTSVTFHNLGDYDIQTGDLLTVTDGDQEKSLTVSLFEVTGINTDTDIVSGTGTPGAQAYVSVYYDGDNIWRRITPDITGAWEMDFSDVVDIRAGSEGSAQERDDDGDSIWYEWNIPIPSFSAFPAEDYLNGHNWPIGEPLFIEVDDPVTPANPDYTGQVSDWDPNVSSFRMINFSGQYDMKPGDIVTVTQGTTIKTHIVTDFAITEIDINTDIVSGWAEPGSGIVSWICDDYGCAERFPTANQDGSWSANFSILGNSPADWGTYDFKPGAGVEASQADEDGDKTVVRMDEPNPRIDARFHENEILGYGWPLDSEITMTIDNPVNGSGIDYTDTQTVVVSELDPNQTFVPFRLWENNFELENGQIVTMSDGFTTKTHVVAVPTITLVNRWPDILEGMAEPFSEIWVDFSDATRHEKADATGHWLANFSVPGDEDFETGTADIQAFRPMGEARVQDEDGDSTTTNWGFPLLLLTLREDGTTYNWIESRAWPARSPIYLAVDDPSTPQNPDYTDVIRSERSSGRADFDYVNFYDHPGFTITISNGYLAKSMIVPILSITGYDLKNDTVNGKSNPYAVVTVGKDCSEDCLEQIERKVTADNNGNWLANFAVSNSPDEVIYDIQPSDNFTTWINEEDWDTTKIHWRVPDQPPFAPFVVLGREGVWLKENSDVMSGDVGANISASGPYLTDQSEVTIGQHVRFLNPDSRVLGDTLYLKQGSQTYDVYYNELQGLGLVLGDHHTPLDLPLFQQLPAVPNVNPGTQNFDLKKNATLTLGAGSYGKLEAKKGAVITFTGGVYHFTEWTLGDDAKIYFAAPTEIRIAGKLDIGSDAFIGPATGTQLTASDIFIYVMDENGKNGKINASPKAAMFGTKTTLIANVYAPNGTLWIRERSTATGAFFGKWVEIGQNAKLTLDNGWH